MKKIILFLLLLSSKAFGEVANLNWNDNTETDLAGYKVYWGTVSRVYPNSVTIGLTSSYQLTISSAGTYYFAVTAFDTSNNESTFSNEVSKVFVGDGPYTMLVNFGATAGSDTYGLSGWNTTIKDVYTENSPLGPGGMTITTGDNYTYNYQGVVGVARAFSVGEKVVITWFNNSTSAITFTPAISFTDSNRRFSDPVGVWYNLASLTIPSKATSTSEFVFDSSNIGSYSVVNVNSNFQNNQLLVCDKIELLSGTTATKIPSTPVNLNVQ